MQFSAEKNELTWRQEKSSRKIKKQGQFNFYITTSFNFKIQVQGTVFFIIIKDLESFFSGAKTECDKKLG